jgi:hypothetical protein
MASTGADRIYNGANDDGSGTVSVVEIASALAAMPVHPKRSVLFITFFGESRACGDRTTMPGTLWCHPRKPSLN